MPHLILRMGHLNWWNIIWVRNLSKKKQPQKWGCPYVIFEIYVPVNYELSSTPASGALVFTEAIPFSMAAVLEYISLLPIT